MAKERRRGGPGWESLGTVESHSEPGIRHEIKRRQTAAGQQFGCSCLSYRFARGEKTCKHIVAFGGLQGSDAQPLIRQVDVRVDSEEFTVRRGISFGGMPVLEPDGSPAPTARVSVARDGATIRLSATEVRELLDALSGVRAADLPLTARAFLWKLRVEVVRELRAQA